MTNQQQGFPNISLPLVDKGGYILQPWFQLLIALWNRTGSAMGNLISGIGTPSNGNLTVFASSSEITNGNLTGDVTTNNTTFTTISPSAVTSSKIAPHAVTLTNIQTATNSSRLLGSGISGIGLSYAELTLSSNLAFTGTSLDLSTTAVSANSYTLGSFTVDSFGRLTNATSASTTGSGAVVLTTSPTISTPNIVGITNASNATAGSVGEYISSTVLQSSPVSLVSNSSVNITSITLTAGDWDVWGTIGFNPTGVTSVLYQLGWTSTTSASVPAYPNNGGMAQTYQPSANGLNAMGISIQRINVTSNTTVYLTANSTWTGGTISSFGFIGARRVR